MTLDLAALRHDGFQCLRGVVPPAAIPAVLQEMERLKVDALKAPVEPPQRALWSDAADGARILRGLQNAHCGSRVIDALRLHPGVMRILRAVFGDVLMTTVVTSLFWKAPGEAETGIAYHQDASFRQPPSAFRNLADSYLQIAIALDPHDAENGGLHFIPGSHREALIYPRPANSVLAGDAGETELRTLGFAPDSAVAVRLSPGDAVLWNAYTLHGSPPNRSRDRDRRSFTIGSMRAEDCDQGFPAF